MDCFCYSRLEGWLWDLAGNPETTLEKWECSNWSPSTWLWRAAKWRVKITGPGPTSSCEGVDKSHSQCPLLYSGLIISTLPALLQRLSKIKYIKPQAQGLAHSTIQLIKLYLLLLLLSSQIICLGQWTTSKLLWRCSSLSGMFSIQQYIQSSYLQSSIYSSMLVNLLEIE